MSPLSCFLLCLVSVREPFPHDLVRLVETEGPLLVGVTDQGAVMHEITCLLDKDFITAVPTGEAQYPEGQRFRATTAGKEALQAWLASPYTPAPRVEDTDIQLRLMAASVLDQFTALSLLEIEVGFRQAQLDYLERGAAAADAQGPADYSDPEWCFSVLRDYHSSTLRRWLDLLNQLHARLTTRVNEDPAD